jgi:hypothetical protein
MDKTVAELNIQHFKTMLETETDPVKQTLHRLLSEQEAKLARAG